MLTSQVKKAAAVIYNCFLLILFAVVGYKFVTQTFFNQKDKEVVALKNDDEDIEVSEDADIEESTENNDSYNTQNEEYTDDSSDTDILDDESEEIELEEIELEETDKK